MNRMLAFMAALLLSALTISSACVAGITEPLHFTLSPAGKTGKLELRFKRDRNGHSESNWSSSFRPAELAGLDVGALNGAGTRPIRFAIVRDAGRVDCAGTGGNAVARGSCRITADRGFNDFLAARGIHRPTLDETYGLIALDVRRALISALVQASYPTPTIQNLFELTAVGVTPAYIGELSGQGYRPESLRGLVEFGALKIAPAYVAAFVRAGYGDLSADELVQLKALEITPQYVAGFQRIGYGRLPVGTLLQLKALDVTPEFVRAVQRGDALPSPDHLVQLRALGRDVRNH